MDNLQIYEKSRECPDNALRTITAGKLKGKSDINPIWRIKKLTELFGPCGIGWKLCNVKYWTEPGAGGEVSAWCSMELKVKVDGQWSDGIEGVGGSMLVNTERSKLVTNDEAFKMAYTDAVSVCCKQLGLAADVYWQADSTKYTGVEDDEPKDPPKPDIMFRCEECGEVLKTYIGLNGKEVSLRKHANGSQEKFGRVLCKSCIDKVQAAGEA